MMVTAKKKSTLTKTPKKTVTKERAKQLMKQLLIDLIHEDDIPIPKHKTIPEAGNHRFHVYSSKFLSYTVIGADNIHHAYNKATLLWGPTWSGVTRRQPKSNSPYDFVPVKEFTKMMRQLRNHGHGTYT